jgi:hypothetical protein
MLALWMNSAFTIGHCLRVRFFTLLVSNIAVLDLRRLESGQYCCYKGLRSACRIEGQFSSGIVYLDILRVAALNAATVKWKNSERET